MGVLYPQILQQQVCQRVGRGCCAHRYYSGRYVRGWGGGAVPIDTTAAGMSEGGGVTLEGKRDGR